MADKPKLFYVLAVPYISEPFFVPRGTPVEIVEWNKDNELIVRSDVCVQQSNSEHSEVPTIAGPYYFIIQPASLEYLRHQER